MQATTERTHERALLAAEGSIDRVVRPTGLFVKHLAGMCVAMCIGAMALSFLFFEGAALIGYSGLMQRSPELSAAVIAFNLSLPMAAWMRLRGHDWRATLEMSGATVVVWILLMGIYWLGILPADPFFPGAPLNNVVEWQLTLACPVMIAVMLFRFDDYSGQAGHHAHGV